MDFSPSKEYPEWIEICNLTGIHKFLPAKKREYKAGYFLDEYKAQYKKTYFEDETNLRNLARKRLETFHRVLAWEQFPFGKLGEKNDSRTAALNQEPGSKKSLLEIGSATGFFLDEAKKIFSSVKGIEISAEGVSYSRDRLGLDVEQGDFLDVSKNWESARFDGIFAFFTLEHMPNIVEVWENLNRLLKPGGGLMLALPSFYGPVFQTQPEEWFFTHPEDHFYDYSPQSIKNVLNQMDMDITFSKPLSYHSGRDLGWKGKLPKFGYKWLADSFCYGDTFQIIAKKK